MRTTSIKRRVFFTALAGAMLVLAVGGWVADGARWAAAGPRRLRLKTA